jgi:hypothetical protein
MSVLEEQVYKPPVECRKFACQVTLAPRARVVRHVTATATCSFQHAYRRSGAFSGVTRWRQRYVPSAAARDVDSAKNPSVVLPAKGDIAVLEGRY